MENIRELAGLGPASPILADSQLTTLARLAKGSPEAFQDALADALQTLVVEGFRTLPAPRNWKEQATAIDLWRKCNGMDSKEKGGVPVGLVGVLRSVNRRAVVDVVGDEGCGFE